MEQIERDLRVLHERRHGWARLPVGTKIEYLLAVRAGVASCAREWAAAAAAAKGIAPDSALVGEEWISGPWAVLYALNRYVRSLRDVARYGSPRLPRGSVRARADGQLVVGVYPSTPYDALLLPGVRAEVWMQRDVGAGDLASSMATFYREPEPSGRVALVLGAGNISSIPVLDILYKFVAEGSVCILKMNPINAFLGPLFERVFEPFVRAGYLRFAYGDATVGKFLCSHDLVDEIHITGSTSTHDAIVAELNDTKPISSELGNVSPTIVIPGNWSASDFRFQAEHIATQKLHNAGYNCVASQVLLLSKAWDGTPKLLAALADALRASAARPAYYPGSQRRRADALALHPGVGPVVRVERLDDPLLTSEAFCDVLGCVEIDGDPAAFLRDAVAFSNQRLPGTLGVNLIVHPRTRRHMIAQIDRAIAELRYGCIAVNTWAGVGYFIAETPWGAYPGNTLDAAGSGIGFVHNSYLFARAQKSVVSAPFRPFPKPSFFITNRMQATIGERLCAFEAHPSPGRFISVAAAALAG